MSDINSLLELARKTKALAEKATGDSWGFEINTEIITEPEDSYEVDFTTIYVADGDGVLEPFDWDLRLFTSDTATKADAEFVAAFRELAPLLANAVIELAEQRKAFEKLAVELVAELVVICDDPIHSQQVKQLAEWASRSVASKMTKGRVIHRSMIDVRTMKVIDEGEFSALVRETYGRPFQFQQYGDFGEPLAQGSYMPITIPDDNDADLTPGVVSLHEWLAREPTKPMGWKEKIEWEREFTPHFSALLNDLHSKGLLDAGEYTMHVWW